MLIETPYKVGDTVSIKLSSGEEMVCRLEEENDTHVIVKKPMMLVAGKNGAGLAPFMFTVDMESKVKLANSSVICVVKTGKEPADMYLKSTTGLQAV